jgi:transposase
MNVLKSQKRSDVVALIRAGHSQREIHRRLEVDRETIRRIVRAQSCGVDAPLSLGAAAVNSKIQNRPGWPPDGGAANSASNRSIPEHARSACEPHREWIEGQVLLGRNAVSIYQDLVERFAFTAKYNSVKRFVRALRHRDPEQYDRLEFSPGEEAQVDFGQGAPTCHPVTGKYRRPWLFVMTLRYSRRAFRKVVWKADQRTWCQLHEEAFRYFGGAVQYVVLDNLKQGVAKPDLYDPELNPLFAAVLKHYDVVADPARVEDPDRKGCVENGIHHTQETALGGRKFETIEEQNDWLMHWEKTWAAPRIHGRAKRQVEEMFQEEKPYLKKLPLLSFRYFDQETRTVWDDGCIEVKRAYYSALPAKLYSQVIVRIYDTEIEIIDSQTQAIIRRHTRNSRAGSIAMEDADRIYNPSRQTDAILSQASGIGPHARSLCEGWFKAEGRTGQRRMRGIVALAKRYAAAHIEHACEIALKGNIRSCKAVRECVERLSERAQSSSRTQQGEGNPSPSLTQIDELIRSGADYAIFFEQHASQGELFEKKTLH